MSSYQLITRPLSDQSIHTKLPLQEDIGAELDDFLLLGLLGIDEEARDLAQTILWRHLRYFLVFSEVADYAIDRDDKQLQEDLWTTIRDQKIRFKAADEQKFLTTITQILDQKRPPPWSWPGTKIEMLRFDQWNSPVLCQGLEVKLTFTLRHTKLSNDFEYHRIVDLMNDFVERGKLGDATRIFAIMTTFTRESIQNLTTSIIFDPIHTTFSILITKLVAAEDDEDADIAQLQSDRFLASMSFLRLLASRKDDDFVFNAVQADIEGILKSTWQLLLSGFGSLPDTAPRGQHLDLCKRLQKDLENAQMAKTKMKQMEKVSSAITTINPIHATQGSCTVTPIGRGASEFHHLPPRLEDTRPIQKSAPPRPLYTQPSSSESPTSSTERFGSPKGPQVEDNPLSQTGPLSDTQMTPSAARYNSSQRKDKAVESVLSEAMAGFIAQRTFQDCFAYYLDHSQQLWEENLMLLENVAVEHFREGRLQAAGRVVQRWLMLRDANAAHEGSLEWMRKLCAHTDRQIKLVDKCDDVLDNLQEALSTPSSSISPGTVEIETKRSDWSRRDGDVARPTMQTTRGDRTKRPANRTSKGPRSPRKSSIGFLELALQRCPT